MAMATATTRTIYRVDDVVRVVEPAVVVRVGYLLTKADALTAAETHHNDKIHAFMKEIGAEQDEILLGGGLDWDARLYGDLLDAVGSYWLRQKKYGGKERKIFTERDERILHTTWRVLSKRVVKTGTYNHGGYSGGYDGEPDYDPPYLENEKTHVLLALEPTTLYEGPWRIEIEAANVEHEKENQ